MQSRLMIGGLSVMVMLSALAVVYVKHENRKLFVQLHELQKDRDTLNIEWGRLQLEQSTWATNGRIEHLARKQLDMRNVNYDNVMMVKP